MLLAMMLSLGPRFSVHITTLESGQASPQNWRMANTYGLMTTKANKNAVLSQLMAVSEVSKYSAAVVERAAKVNHYVHRVSTTFDHATGLHNLRPSSQ